MHAEMTYALAQVTAQPCSAHAKGLTAVRIFVICDSMLLRLLAPWEHRRQEKGRIAMLMT